MGRSKKPLQTWVHRSRSDTAANANANSDAPRIDSLAIANGFANEVAEIRCRCGNSLRMDVCDKIR